MTRICLSVLRSMNFKLTLATKVFIAFFCTLAAFIGFMVKLPSEFHRIDKLLHAGFYCCAAAFFNLLFEAKSVWKHAIIFALLFLFGVGIEFAQESWNRWFHVRIHGRFDPEDIRANLKGLLLFSGIWLLLMAGRLVFRGRKGVEGGKVGEKERG